jgi:hypothetical protein
LAPIVWLNNGVLRITPPPPPPSRELISRSHRLGEICLTLLLHPCAARAPVDPLAAPDCLCKGLCGVGDFFVIPLLL